VAEVMRYMLFKSNQTSDCPIKREELVINEARDRLAATFGYEMRELQRTAPPSARSGRPSQPLRKPSFGESGEAAPSLIPYQVMSSDSVPASPGHPVVACPLLVNVPCDVMPWRGAIGACTCVFFRGF
jgi:hypothetical protein